MTHKRSLLILACLAVAATSASAGQGAAPKAENAQATAVEAAPPASAGFSYDAAGRRDPFVSLVKRGTESRPASGRPSGVSGLLIAEITVKGILKDRSGFIAMIQGPDNKQTYIVRSGEQVLDGTVKTITADAVVFSQDVNDPLSTVKQKEIRKTIRPTEAGRG